TRRIQVRKTSPLKASAQLELHDHAGGIARQLGEHQGEAEGTRGAAQARRHDGECPGEHRSDLADSAPVYDREEAREATGRGSGKHRPAGGGLRIASLTSLRPSRAADPVVDVYDSPRRP